MSEETGNRRSGLRLGLGISAVVLIVVVIAGIGTPKIISSKPKGPRAQAISNAKQVGLALFTFQDDYGSYPYAATVTTVKENYPDTTAKLGNTTSNDFFRQLIASGTIDQEMPFFAQTLTSRKPDNVMTRTKLMEKGEVGFSYVASHATSYGKVFPIILTPLVKGKLLFDYQSARTFFDGSVVVLSTDNSVAVHTVDKDGHVWINGKDFFDPTQPYWHGIAPKVAWPE